MPETGGKKSKFEFILGAVDKLTSPFRKIQSAFTALGEKSDALKAKLGRFGDVSGFTILRGHVARLKAGFKDVYSEGSAALGRVTGMVGKLSLAFGAAGGGALALAKATANAGDVAAKSAARAGTSIAVWQEYAHAASLSDVNEEQLSKGFLKLQDTALKAARGEKAQAGLLRLAGIDPKTAKGEVKNAELLFLELSDKIKALLDQGQKGKAANLLQSMLGEEGVKLMPMLSGGAESLKELRAEAHKLGLVFSDEDAHASEAFNDALTRSAQSLQGIGFAIGRSALPALTKLADKFTAWASSSREVIGTGFAEWVESIDLDRLWESVEGGLGTLKSLWRSIQTGVEWLGGWGNVAKIAAGIIGAKLVVALASLAGSFGTLGLAILATPVGWFMAAIAGIAGSAYLIYKKWDGFAAFFSENFAAVKSAFLSNWAGSIVKGLALFNPVALVMDAVNRFIRYLTGIDLYAIGKNMIGGFFAGVREKWADFTDWISGAASKISGLFGGAGDSGQPGAESGSSSPFPMAKAMNLAPAAAGIVRESIQKTETVERSELKVTVQSKDGSPVEAALSGRANSAIALDDGQLMQGAW